MHIYVVKLKTLPATILMLLPNCNAVFSLPAEHPNRWGIAASGNMTGLIATGIF